MPCGRGSRRGRVISVWATYRSAQDGISSRGRISKARSACGSRGSGGRGASRTRTPAHVPYTPLEYPQAESLYFGTADTWDISKLVEGVKKITFGEEFDIRDSHLDAIIAAGPSFCLSLQNFSSGDRETGKGGSLTDAAVARVAEACLNPIHASLEGSKCLTDASLLAFRTHYPNLRYLEIKGNDRVSGNLKGPALDTMRENKELGKKSEKMHLTDQDTLDKKLKDAIKGLSASRKKLAIEMGSTHERSGHITTWLGGKEKMGYQAFGGPGGFNQYGGFSRF